MMLVLGVIVMVLGVAGFFGSGNWVQRLASLTVVGVGVVVLLAVGA